MDLQIHTLAERPEITDVFWDMETSWSEFMKHDPIGNGYYGLREEFADFVLVCFDESGRLVAKAHSVPFRLEGDVLPDGGWDFAIHSGLLTKLRGEEPNACSAVEIAIVPELQGTGLSGRILAPRQRRPPGIRRAARAGATQREDGPARADDGVRPPHP